MLGGEWYFSWGYNRDYWQPSDIHISQPALNNNFTIHGVTAKDFPQWDTNAIYQDPSAPQTNIRVGHFFDKDRSLGIEFSFDHTKYSSILNQTGHITGIVAGQPVDLYQPLSTNYFMYNLHNGANYLMLNLVKRVSLIGNLNQTFNFSFIAKAGAGLVFPHAENTVMGNTNNVGSKTPDNWFGVHSGWWQLNGWTAGIEAGVRLVIYKPVYLEFTDKEAYANLTGVPVYQGVANQQLWLNELILSAGITLDGA